MRLRCRLLRRFCWGLRWDSLVVRRGILLLLTCVFAVVVRTSVKGRTWVALSTWVAGVRSIGGAWGTEAAVEVVGNLGCCFAKSCSSYNSS